MKNNNTFKRVAAGALAAISVAGYTVPANVGGFLTNTSVLTAGAVDEAAKLDELKLTGANLSDSFTSFKAKIKVDGQLIDEELTERRQIRDFFTLAHNDKLVQGSDVEIKSIVPLNINVGKIAYAALTDIGKDASGNFYKNGAADNKYSLLANNAAGNTLGVDVYYNNDNATKPFEPINNGTPLAPNYESFYKTDGTKATTAENAKFYYDGAYWHAIYAVASAQPDTLVKVTGGSSDTYYEKVSDADFIFATLWDKTKSQPNVGKDTYIYGLNESEVREVANNSSFDAAKANISVAAPYYTATGRDDTGYTYTFKVPKGANNLSGNAGDAGVISISAATTIVNVDYSDSTEADIENLKDNAYWGSTAKFPDSAPDKIEIKKFEKDANNNEVSVKVIASTTAAGTAITKDGVNITAFQNEKIKIVADQNFGAYYWSGLANAGAEYGVATYDSNVDSDTAGKYVLEINAPYGTGAAPKVVLTALPNVVSYTMGENDTAIFATGSGYSNAAVAELTAKYQESGKTDKTNIAFDGSVPNATIVELGLDVVPELLKTSSSKTWKATLTRNKGTATEATVTAEGADAFTIANNGANNWKIVQDALIAKDTNADKNKQVFTTEAAVGITNPTDANKKIIGAGKYELALTVYVNEYDSNGVATITPKTIKYNFEIKTKNALTASNVKVVATTAKDVLVDDANTEVSTLSYFANPYGVLQFRASSKFNSDSVQLEGIVYDDTKQTVIGQYSGNDFANAKNSNQPYNAATQFNVTTGGYDRQNTLNDIETLEIRFLDAEYGADEQVISIPYVITDNAVATVDYIGDEVGGANGMFASANTNGDNPNIKLSMDTIDKLETKIFDTYYVNGIDEDQVVFEYSEGKDKRIDVRELEWREPGLPNAVGNYTVFLTYNGEAFAAVNVEIAEHTMYFVPSEDALNMTFGDKLTFKTDYTPTGVDGKAVKADMPEVQYTIYKPAYDVNGEIMTDEDGVPLVANKTARPAQSERKSPYYVANKAYDTYYTYDKAIGKRGYLPAAGTEDLYYKVKNSDAADLLADNANVKHSPDYNAAKELYNAGVYVVKMSGSVNKNSGYVVEDQYFLVNIDQVEITDKTFVIYPATVQKNNTTGYTVGAGTGAQNNAKIEVVKKYADLGLQLSVVSGKTTQSDIGDYDITIGANAADIASVRNFKGTVPTQWHVIKRATQDSMKGLEFLPKKTALTGDAQIVIRAQRPEDNKLLTGSTADAKVSRVGFVVDTKGKLAAPKYDTVEQYMNMDYTSANKAADNHGGDTAIQNAYEALQLNNGFRETNTQDVSKTEFGANIYMPEDTSIGVWLRPYVLLTDGTIYYGDVKYLNITAEATYYLNLKMGDQNNALYNNPGVAAKDNKDVKKDMGVEGKITDTAKKIEFRKKVQSGYHASDDSFFAYGSYTLTSNEIVKASAVKKFGIIADDSGVFAAPTAAEYYGTNTEKVSVKDGLKLRNDNLFATGSAKADNPQYDTDEYGLKLTRKSQKSKVTGIWARGYVDLGDGIVVYTDPVYISSVSDYYTKDAGATAGVGRQGEVNVGLNIASVAFGVGANKSSKMITLTTNNLYVKGLSSNVAIPQVGLVVDETGSLLTKVGNTYKAKIIDGEYAADKRLVLDNGYKQGAFNNKTLQNGPQNFTYMQKPLVDADGDEIPLVIRPFVKLNIFGNDVIIYGKPVTNITAAGIAADGASNTVRYLDGTVANPDA